MVSYYFYLISQKDQRKQKNLLNNFLKGEHNYFAKKSTKINNSAFPPYLTKVMYVYMNIYICICIYFY